MDDRIIIIGFQLSPPLASFSQDAGPYSSRTTSYFRDLQVPEGAEETHVRSQDLPSFIISLSLFVH